MIDAALKYTRVLNSGCVWNRSVSCLLTKVGEVGPAMPMLPLVKCVFTFVWSKLPTSRVVTSMRADFESGYKLKLG